MAGQNFTQATIAATDNGVKVFKALQIPVNVEAQEIAGAAPALNVYSFSPVTLLADVPNTQASGSTEAYAYKVPAGQWLFLGAEAVKTDAAGDAGDILELAYAPGGDINSSSIIATFDLSGSATGSVLFPTVDLPAQSLNASSGDWLAIAATAGSGSFNTAALVTIKLGLKP